MNPSGHIEDKHIQRLTSVSDIPDSERAALLSHISSCTVCRDRLLSELASDAPFGNCPDPSVWWKLGVSQPKIDPLQLVRHAASCESCRALLHSALESDGALSGDEEQFLSGLASAKPLFQQHLAERMAGGVQQTFTVAPKRRMFSTRWLVSGAATAAIAAGVIGTFAYSHYQNSPDRVSKLLAQSYSEHRTLEARLPHAEYAPLAQTRGANSTRPLPLIEAELAITKALAANPSDPRWLGQKAELLLLQNNLPEASKTIRRALDADPESPQLRTIEASIEMQQAAAGEHFANAEALDSLSIALKTKPDDPVLLFNRALAFEANQMLPEAKADWEHYLKVDPGSKWTEEAHKHLSDIEEQLRKHELSKAPLLGPSGYVQALRGGSEDQKRLLLLNNESYMHNALSEWLPAAFPQKGSPSQDAVNALEALAEFNHDRGDDTLNDLIAGSSAPDFPSDAALLAQAYAGWKTHLTKNFVPPATEAAQKFAAHQNFAGQALAVQLLMLGDFMELREHDCIAHAQQTISLSHDRHYVWIEGLSTIQMASCYSSSDNAERDRRLLLHATDILRRSPFQMEYARAVFYLTDYQNKSGDVDGAWLALTNVLHDYWHNAIVGQLASYSLHMMADDAADAHLFRAALETKQAEIALRPKDALAAYAYAQAGGIALASGDLAASEKYYTAAQQILDAAPDSPQIQTYKALNTIGKVQLAYERGDDASVIATLSPFQAQLVSRSPNFLLNAVLPLIGASYLRAGDRTRAEPLLLEALQVLPATRSGSNDANQLRWMQNVGRAYRGLVQLRLEQGRVKDAFDIWQKFLKSSFGGDSQPSLAPNDNPRNADLFYVRLETGDWGVFVRRAGHITWHKVPVPDRELKTAVARFARLCSDPDSRMSDVESDAKTLYRWLLRPANADIEDATNIALQSNGVLQEIPFAALANADGKLVGEKWNLKMIAVGDHDASGVHVLPGLHAVVIGSPALGDSAELSPLPDADREASNVASRFKAADLLKGEDATYERTTSALAHSDVLHFAGHALSGNLNAGLVLAPDASTGQKPHTLTSRDIEAHRMTRSQLVVLSACSTDSRRVFGTTDNQDLARAFLRAGARDVVASRWEVDSRSTSLLMRHFYDALLQGSTPEESMRLARSAVRETPLFSHPFYWSAFEVNSRD